MRFFDGALRSEAGNDDGAQVRLIRDKYGRLAVSRPSSRPYARTRRSSPPPPSNPATGNEVEANKAEGNHVVKTKTSKESLKVGSSQKSKASVKMMWGDDEDLQLLELKHDRKSWEYIAGKMDGRGKDLPALKARYNDLSSQKAQQARKESKDEAKTGKNNSASTEKGKKGKDKNKEEAGAESDGGSKKSEKGSPKTGGILKNSPNNGKTETHGVQGTAKNDEKDPLLSKPGEKSIYTGRKGFGELHFFNDSRVLYQNSGSEAEPLDAESVALIQKEATRYDRGKWLAVASRLFDKTAIRIDPELVRRALEG